MNELLIEKIEAFLEGEISREELQKMAEEAGIANLDEEIQWFQDSRVAIASAGLRRQLKEVLPQPAKKETRVVRLRSIRRVLAVAASVLVIVVAYWGLNRSGQSSLYADYEYVDPGLPVLMSQSKDHQLYDALSYYSEGNYSVAEEKLQQIQADYPNSDTLAYYLGASLLYQGKTEAAKAPLEEVSTFENSRFRQRADWLLVMAALKEKNLEEAGTLVELILNTPGHEFTDRAQALQQDLDQ
jgi:TolA-binding protein